MEAWGLAALGRVARVGMAAAILLGWAALANAAEVYANPLNRDPLVREAYQRFYILDYPGAIERFERFHALHPGDPQATALLLNAVLFQELYREDLLDTTFYANDGFLTGRHATNEDPKVRDRIFALTDETVREADWRIGQNNRDADAYFARGWARSLKAAYMAMVERAFGSAFHLAIQARGDHARVLDLNPDYVDAKLVVGTYEYVVGALPFAFKILIGFAGITGSKSKGMEMLRDAGDRGVITSVEARTVIALFLRREAKYQQAAAVIHSLKEQYPRDFLFCLEEANIRKDAGEGMRAVAVYQELLAQAAEPGYFPQAQIELAYFGLGDALRGQRQYLEAAQAYERAAGTPGAGPELKVRSWLDAGECHDLLGERQTALADYRRAIDAGPNTSRADTARRMLRSAYQGQ